MKQGKCIFIIFILAALLFTWIEVLDSKYASALDESYFKGKKITFLVPFKPGGGFDTYARILSPYIEKYLPVRNVIVKNDPAGGGLSAMNRLALSKPDGTTIMIFQTSAAVVNELAKVKGVRYQSGKFTWLARLAATPYVMVSNPNSSIKTLEDMRSAKKEVVIAGVGRDFSTMAAVLMCEAFGIPHREILGYGGTGEMVMGIIRKDSDICAMSYDSAKPSIDAGELFGVMMMTQEKIDANIPLFTQEADRFNISAKNRAVLASVAGLLDIYRTVAASPGLSPELAKLMRTAFGKAINDPEFLAAAKKSNRPIDFLNGEETQKLVDESVINLRNDEVAMKMIKQMFGG